MSAVPLASVCHDPHYDQSACTALANDWVLPQSHYQNSAEFMAPYWQNQSCDPFTPRSHACQLGNYVSYSVNVSCAADAAAGLKFAEKHNLRLVIKNTGHDYNGKSTGRGALQLWTHNLKTAEYFNYTSFFYTGPAGKFGAGVQLNEIYVSAAAHGLRLVGGECATVGYAGGYLQGGGHSALSSTYGMAADQVLEWEVVTADGTHLVASPTQHSDLYWALSGGGGGTYGVVLSVTVKAFEDGIVGGALIAFNQSANSYDTFWEAIKEFHAHLPALVDTGAGVLYSLTNTTFEIVPITSPGSTKEDMQKLLSPYLTSLKAMGAQISLTITSYPNYLEHFNFYLGPLPYGNPVVNIIDVTLAGRLIPRTVIENSTSNEAFMNALKLSVYPGGDFVTGGIGLKATHEVAGNNASSNAVLPAWRDALVSILAFAPWNFTSSFPSNTASQNYLIDVTVPALAALAPDGGAYLNEGNALQQDWKQSFYGSNYERLLSVKNKYDPNDLFYALTAVGSEAWALANDGRLCKSG
ncbi:hypothetical protein QM012_006367 [Aureobasidium pullulans]|uniref:FAD-binding PCMH-type domain-containing protein n=1 Tax=Aureobasidium pullulans TaxID=5580 RepID=A0ABR0TNG3_AURPU